VVLLAGSECFAQMIFKSVQALEDPIVEELFTQIIPDMPESAAYRTCF